MEEGITLKLNKFETSSPTNTLSQVWSKLAVERTNYEKFMTTTTNLDHTLTTFE
jgi:hypothetical protein